MRNHDEISPMTMVLALAATALLIWAMCEWHLKHLCTRYEDGVETVCTATDSTGHTCIHSITKPIKVCAERAP